MSQTSVLPLFSRNSGYRVKNMIGKLPINGGGYGLRSTPILFVAIHHSLTLTGDATAFAKYHTGTLRWPGIGYTYVLGKDGTVEVCASEEKKTYHVGRHNSVALGICLVGDFRVEEPTEDQSASLTWLLRDILSRNSTIRDIKGHSSFEGYSWKDCPVFSVEDYLKAYGLKDYSSDTEYRLTFRWKEQERREV